MSQDDEKSNCDVILGYGFRVSLFLGFLLAGIEEDFLVQIPCVARNKTVRSKILSTLCSIQVWNETSLSKFWKKHYKIGKP